MRTDFQGEEKAGWNSSEEIIKTLSVLRNTYIGCKLAEDYPKALETIRCILDVISGKVDDDKANEINLKIYKLELILPKATETYMNRENGGVYFRNPLLRIEFKKEVEKLYREVARLEDKCGFGMISQDDPRFAVAMR